MTSPTDNDIIEAVARAICVQHQHGPDDELPTDRPDVIDNAGVATIVAKPRGKQWMIFMEDAQAAVTAAEPLITNRAQEAVLRHLLKWTLERGSEKPVAIVTFARERYGLTLDGDGNAQ